MQQKRALELAEEIELRPIIKELALKPTRVLIKSAKRSAQMQHNY
jgi:hypothetical protein